MNIIAREDTADSSIDNILGSLLQILPILHKKLLRMDLGGVTGDLTRLHFAIMGMLSERNFTVSEIGGLLAIPKSQMTRLVDRLVVLDAVERRPDTVDRRVINLALTDHGRLVLEDVKGKVIEGIKERLAGLTPKERASMSTALETVKGIVAKL